MSANRYIGLLAMGMVAVFVGTAAATDDPIPVIKLAMDGNLLNTGSGGSAYNGVLQTANTQYGTPVYGSGQNVFVNGPSGQSLCLNPGLVATTAGQIISADGGSNVAIAYRPANSGTIALWYKVTSPAYGYQELFNNSVDSQSWEGWISDSGTVGARVTGWDSNMTTNSALAAGWHHVAFTWDRHTDDTTKVSSAVYVDGAVVTSTVLSNLDWIEPGTQFYIGGNHGNTPANGYFQDFRIYDQVLTAGQIGSMVPEPGSVALMFTGLIGALMYAWRKRK